jgi:hypothetical protein
MSQKLRGSLAHVECVQVVAFSMEALKTKDRETGITPSCMCAIASIGVSNVGMVGG